MKQAGAMHDITPRIHDIYLRSWEKEMSRDTLYNNLNCLTVI